MVNLNELQLLAQLVDNIEISIGKLEKSYKDNDGENFQKSKQSILDFQQKISKIIK